MHRLIFTFALLMFLAMAAFAQDGASITVGAFATTNNPNQITANNIGLSLAGEFRFKGAAIGGEAYGRDTNPARSRYWGSYDAYSWHGVALSAGGGYYRFGANDGGFGQAGLRYDRFAAFGRYGSHNFTEADAQFAVVRVDHLSLAPFYRYSRHGDFAKQPIHSAGLRLTFK